MANPLTPEQISQILEEFFKVVGTRQYIGARYVPIFGRKGEESIEWDNSAPYEPLTIVLYQGNSYTSRQYVPVGVEITNQEFWALTGNFNAQIEAYRKEVRDILPYDETPTEGSTKGVTSDGIKKAIDSAVSVETTRAKEAEEANAKAIADETTRAKIAEQANAGAIADETTRAKEAEQTNATAIARINADERFIPVEHYGVKTTNDASTNNSAFQTALNECASNNKTLVFGAGTYEFTGNIEMPDHGKITGVSLTDTLIHCTGDNFIHTKTKSDNSFVTLDGEISNMQIYGDVTPDDKNPYLELVRSDTYENEFCLNLGFLGGKLENLYIHNVKGAICERPRYVGTKDYMYYIHFGNIYDFRNILIYTCGCGIKSTASDVRWTHLNMGRCYAGSLINYGEIHDVHVWGFFYPLQLERVVATNLEIESNGLLDSSVADFKNGTFLQIWNTTIAGAYFWNLYGTNDVSSSTDSPGILVRGDWDSNMNSGSSITGLLIGPYIHNHGNHTLYPSPSKGLIGTVGSYDKQPNRIQPCYVQGVISSVYTAGKLGDGSIVFNVIANNTNATITHAINATAAPRTISIGS